MDNYKDRMAKILIEAFNDGVKHGINWIPISAGVPVAYLCPACGEEIEEGDHYCKHCGQKIEWKEKANEQLRDVR